MSQAVISIALAASDVFSILSKKAPFRLDLRPQGPASFRRLDAYGIEPLSRATSSLENQNRLGLLAPSYSLPILSRFRTQQHRDSLPKFKSKFRPIKLDDRFDDLDAVGRIVGNIQSQIP